jgi:hypothetical protein
MKPDLCSGIRKNSAWDKLGIFANSATIPLQLQSALNEATPIKKAVMDPSVAADPPRHDTCGDSALSISIISGPGLSLWSDTTASQGETGKELALRLQPERIVIIGRQEGGEIEYLDPHYHPTQMLPNSGRPVVTSLHGEADRRVSRGHFMLRGTSAGILLVNGVPRRGGGIRPPLNGTVMVEPAHRQMADGEEHLIEHGNSAMIRLPNLTVVLICAAVA